MKGSSQSKHMNLMGNTALARLCLVVTDEKGQQAIKPASQQASSR